MADLVNGNTANNCNTATAAPAFSPSPYLCRHSHFPVPRLNCPFCRASLGSSILRELTSQSPGLLVQDGFSDAEVESFKETEIWKAFIKQDELGEQGEGGWLPTVRELGWSVGEMGKDGEAEAAAEGSAQGEQDVDSNERGTGTAKEHVAKAAEEMEHQMAVNSLKVMNRRMTAAREWVKEWRESETVREGE